MFNMLSGIWASRLRTMVDVQVQSLMIVSCDTVITLAATVTGNLADRMFEWVQQSGTAVEWLESRFQLQVMFNQTQVRDDKVFRFYVDKGLTSQVYADVLVTAVPRETVGLFNASTPATGLNYVASEQTSGFVILPGISPTGQTSTDNAVRMLMWTNPDEYYFHSNTVVKVSGVSSSTTVGKSNYYGAAAFNETYRIDSTMDYYGVVRLTSSQHISTAPVLGNRDADATETTAISLSASESLGSLLEVITRELTFVQPDDEVISIFQDTHKFENSVLEVITRELTQTEVPSETTTLFSMSNQSFSCTILELSSVGITSLG